MTGISGGFYSKPKSFRGPDGYTYGRKFARILQYIIPFGALAEKWRMVMRKRRIKMRRNTRKTTMWKNKKKTDPIVGSLY